MFVYWGKNAFLSLVGMNLSLINSFIRNVKCGYVSMHPSFRAQAGRSEDPDDSIAFFLFYFFDPSFTYKPESVFFGSCVFDVCRINNVIVIFLLMKHASLENL